MAKPGDLNGSSSRPFLHALPSSTWPSGPWKVSGRYRLGAGPAAGLGPGGVVVPLAGELAAAAVIELVGALSAVVREWLCAPALGDIRLVGRFVRMPGGHLLSGIHPILWTLCPVPC